jgi:hypothetical protein
MTPERAEGLKLAERLRASCVGHPHAKIPWPHRLLHEAADGEIRRLREASQAAFDCFSANAFDDLSADERRVCTALKLALAPALQPAQEQI